MEIGECQDIDLEFEGHDLIDSYHFPDTVDDKKDGDSAAIHVNDHLLELHDSKEPERNKKNGRYNLRKSLAWDSAFFTNAGVLDAEELSSMITKTDKKEKHILPGIQEEITGSTESISTLQSDCLTLDSFEGDLFMDIRASIQRSSKKASTLTKSSSKLPAMELDSPATSSPKIEEFVFQNKNPKPGVKKTSSLQTARMSKSQLKPMAKVSSGRPIKQDSVQSQVGSIGKAREANSALPKPLKSIGSSVPSSTVAKRESVGTGRVKIECRSSKQGSFAGKETQLPKVSALGSRKMLPKPTMSSKSSSLGSLTSTVHSTRSSTSSDNSINTSSGNAAKPTILTARRNLGKCSTISTGTSGSIPKSPLRAVPKNKLPASSLSAYLKSTKISSSVSPASSISEWSSASSTSSVVKQRSSISRTSLDTSSSKSVDADSICLDPRDNLTGQKAERQENQGAMKSTLKSNTLKKSSAESGTHQDPAKPSGLRLPSPKIGFFDGSSSRTPNGKQRSQSGLPPKNGAATSTPTRSSNGKLKSAKVPTAKMDTSLANIKAVSPASSQEKLHALVEASSASMDANDSYSLSLGVKGSGTGETNQKTVEVEAENSKLRSAKVTTARMANSLANIKSGSPKAAFPAISQEKSRALVETSSVSIDGNESCSLSIGVEGSRTGATCQKAVEVEAGNGNVKSVEDPTARMDTLLVNINSDSPKAAFPAFSQEKSHDLVKASRVFMDVDDSSSLSFGAKGSATGETCQKPVEVESENGNAKSAEDPTARMDTLLENIKSGSPKASSPTSSQEKAHDLVKTSSFYMDIDDSSSLSFGAKGSSTGETCQKAVEVKAEDGNAKSAEDPTARMDTLLVNIKSGSPKVSYPTSSQEKSHDLVKASSGYMDIDDSSRLSFGAKGSATGETCPKAVEVKEEDGNAKSAEDPTARMDTLLVNIKSGSPKVSYPTSSQEKSHDLVKASSGYMDIDDSSRLSFGAKGSATGETCPKAVEVESDNGNIKSAEDPAARMGTLLVNIKSGSPKAASPASSHENSRALVKASSDTMDVDDTSSLSFAVKGSATGEICQEAVEVVAENGVNQAVLDAIIDNLSNLSLNGNMSSEDIDTATCGSEYIEKKSNPTSEVIEKENDPTHCQGKGEGLTGDKRGICKKNQEPNCQLLSDTSECALSSTAAAACRPPFALKNFSCSNEFVVKPTELVFQVAGAENTGLALPSSIEKENCC